MVSAFRRARLRLDVTSLVASIGLLGIVLTLAFTAVLAWMEYERRLQDARDELRTEAFFLSDHANRLFEVARIAIKASTAIVGDRSWNEIAGSADLSMQLRSFVKSIPYIEDVWFNDPTGELRATSFSWPSPRSNASDRENFKAAQQDTDDIFVGPLIVGRVTHRPTFLLSTRIPSQSDPFRGMVSVTADLSYFEDYWEGIALPYDARVTLSRAPTAEVLAQFPGGTVTKPAGLQSLVENLAADGSYDGTGDGGRFGFARKVGDYPIYLSVDVSNAAVVAGWRHWLANIIVLPAGAIVLFSTLTWLALRDARNEMKTRRSLAAANNELTVEMVRREKAEDQVRQLQKIEAIGQLTGGIAHDFNNMLAIIVGSLSLIEKRLQRNDYDIAKYLAAAQSGAQRAASLTQRLLAFARKQPLSPQIIDANRFVSGMSELLQRTLTEAIQIETVLGAGLWKTNADPAQLENALLNLAVNARDAMASGGKLTIETANASLDLAYASEQAGVPSGQYILIAVTDTGSGMSAEIANRVFEPFFTTKAVGKGSGLGLSQVYGFVRQSGGHVKIYSEVGQGTTVKIYLPRYYGPEGESDPHRAQAGPTPVGRPGEVILIVEDEADVRRLSVDALRELGYTVLHADGAAGALQMLRATPRIDLLFTDIVMPEMNGRQLAENALAIKPEIKVLYMTGYTRNAVVHNGLLDPGVRLIGKPFSLEQLAVSVRKALDT